MDSSNFRPTLAKETFKIYTRASFSFRKMALLSFLNPIGAMLTNVAVPYFAGRALVGAANSGQNFKTDMLLLVLAALMGVAANRIGFNNLMVLQAKTMSLLHSMVFNRLLQRGISFHTNRIGGKLVSDALDFVGAYGNLLMALYNSGVSFALMLASGLVIIFISSWQLGLFLSLVVGVTITWAYRESQTRNNLRSIRLMATKKLTGHLSDSIVNAQTVKTFAGEAQEKATNTQLNTTLRNLRISDWQRAGKSGNNRIAVLLLMLVGLLLLINLLAKTQPNILAIGIFAFTYTFTLMLRLFDINTLTRQIEESLLQASPMTQMLLEANEIKDLPDAPKLNVTNGNIQLNNVGFHYTDTQGQRAVFKNLNLTIQPGEKLGVVGPSGSGKTTLTRILLRFEDIQAGQIEIDSQNVATVTQASLRQAIAYVPQEPLLFHRSIKENIAYGRSTATTEEVRRAAKLAYADDFINELPNGYDTIVGERGVKLSGGQRQRVAIARAILKDAPILILDEATSALDSESEKVIQKALIELMKNRTTIVIAHRLSTIQKMDRIIVLDNGQIIENGHHNELLKTPGMYARLWNHQTGGFIEE